VAGPPAVSAPHETAFDRRLRAGVILYTISTLLLITGVFMVSGVVVAWIYHETEAMRGFLSAVGITLLVGVTGFLAFRRHRNAALLTRDGFLVVVLSWLVGSAFGALPFVITGAIPSYTDAYFETISGYTTTGASILPHIEGLPYSVLFWRSLIHWLGGMGIVVLTVAILPRLGIGGLKLMRTEAPGPTLDKLTPRVTETAKILWGIYLGLTVLEVAMLLVAGLGWFDALTHTFGTLATGGFSPRNASVGAYDSAFVDVVVTVFMLLAAINFSLYFHAFRGEARLLARNTELRVYLAVFVIGVVLVTLSVTGSVYGSIGEGVRFAGFQVASILTTTGFATADYDIWPPLAKGVLVTLMLVGGCAGSTAGGVKVIRLVTLFKQGLNELKYLVHPQGIFTLKIGDRPVKKDILYPVAVFFFLYVTLVMITALIVSAAGQDLITSISTGLATVGNIGPGFGAIGPSHNYGHYPDPVKWWLSFAMLTGRLEVYSVLVLFTRTFWRQ
jgi:trk system potassium uptake protein TrkH